MLYFGCTCMINVHRALTCLTIYTTDKKRKNLLTPLDGGKIIVSRKAFFYFNRLFLHKWTFEINVRF